MKKKYEFTGETKQYEGRTLKRIRRLSDQLVGGWIERENNLSHSGNCFVYHEAKVFDNAAVCGDAKVYGRALVFGKATADDDAKVFGSAKVHGNAEVRGNARIYDNAQVDDNSKVYGSAVVYHNARVYDDAGVFGKARVYGNARVSNHSHVFGKDVVTKQAINITGLPRHSITVTDNHINIGCIQLTLEEWYKQYKQIGINNGYTEDEIEGYKNLIYALSHFIIK